MQVVPPKHLYLMQGVPGSGKSTMARRLLRDLTRDDGWPLEIVGKILSTDDHRYKDCGHYIHDPVKNLTYHAWTQRDAADALRAGINYVIIDNTNILKEHAYPYIALARMYDYKVDVIRVDPGLAEAKSRNKTRPLDRQVPGDVIERMYATMERLL